MEPAISSLNYVTLLFGVTRLMVALYAFCLAGIRVQKEQQLASFVFMRIFIFSLGLWELTRAIYFLYPGTEYLPRLMAIVQMTVPFTSLALFLFCLSYAFPTKVNRIRQFLWLGIIPCITTLCSLIPALNKYCITYSTQLVYIPYRENIMIIGPWFYVHTVYSYLLVLGGIACLVIKIRSPNNQNKKFSFYAVIAALMFIFYNMYRSFISNPKAIWFIPILSIAVITLFFWIVYADETLFIIEKGQNQLMKSLLFPVFFLDKDGSIIYANQEALKICPNIQASAPVLGHEQDIMINFAPYVIDSKLEDYSNFQSEENLLLQSKVDDSLYYIQQKTISTTQKNKSDYLQGKIMLLVTVSSIQSLFSVLENNAFRDSLCGCYNRHFLELKQLELSKGGTNLHAMFPITFIMCDMDNLKKVNDNFGHSTGNEYIMLCHDTIKSAIRQSDWIFRIGGDEFLVMLPQTERKVAQSIVAKIEEKMAQVKKPYPTSISIGTFTTDQPPIDYQQCMREADQMMYKQKQERRRG